MKRIISMLLAALMCFGVMGLTAFAEEEEFYLGDTNKDGWIDNTDASLMLKYDAGLIDLAEEALALSDTNYDGMVDNADASLTLKYDAGIIWDFCREHAWIEATCSEAKYCENCYLTIGEALGHNVVDGACTNEGCAYTDAKAKALSDIIDYIVENGEEESGTYTYTNMISMGEDGIKAVAYSHDESIPESLVFTYVWDDGNGGYSAVSLNYGVVSDMMEVVYLYMTEAAFEMAYGYIDASTFDEANPTLIDFDTEMVTDGDYATEVTSEGLVALLNRTEKFLDESGLGCTLTDLGFTAF